VGGVGGVVVGRRSGSHGGLVLSVGSNGRLSRNASIVVL
jgi:hypothetical protein